MSPDGTPKIGDFSFAQSTNCEYLSGRMSSTETEYTSLAVSKKKWGGVIVWDWSRVGGGGGECDGMGIGPGVGGDSMGIGQDAFLVRLEFSI